MLGASQELSTGWASLGTQMAAQNPLQQSFQQAYGVENHQEPQQKTLGMVVDRLDKFSERLAKLYVQVDNIGVRLNVV